MCVLTPASKDVTSLAGKELELIRGIERYRLDIGGLISTH